MEEQSGLTDWNNIIFLTFKGPFLQPEAAADFKNNFVMVSQQCPRRFKAHQARVVLTASSNHQEIRARPVTHWSHHPPQEVASPLHAREHPDLLSTSTFPLRSSQASEYGRCLLIEAHWLWDLSPLYSSCNCCEMVRSWHETNSSFDELIENNLLSSKCRRFLWMLVFSKKESQICRFFILFIFNYTSISSRFTHICSMRLGVLGEKKY